MNYVWIMYGVCMDDLWIMYGLCMDYLWIVYGVCMDYVCLQEVPGGSKSQKSMPL